MTVSAQSPVATRVYTGPGDYDFNFLVYDVANLEITIVDSSGNPQALTVANYSAITLSPEVGGTVTITDALGELPSSGTLYIRRVMAYQQTIDWINNEAFNMELLERSQDQMVMMLQQIDRIVRDAMSLNTWRGNWTGPRVYAVRDIVIAPNGNWYVCSEAHTSDDFDADLASGYWLLALDLVAVTDLRDQAAASAAASEADRILADADLAATNADVVLTHADVVLTHADVAATNADVATTNADVLLTHADAAATAADRVQTGNDKSGTAADLVQTNQDVLDTAANLAATDQDTIDTAADRVQTGLDAVATAADRVQTGLDVAALGEDVALTHADVLLTAADRVQTGLDRVATGEDVVTTQGMVDSIDEPTILRKDADTGAAILPPGTTAQRPSPPSEGMLRYNTDLSAFEGYQNGAWGTVGGGASGAVQNPVFYENDTNVTGDYTITTGKNAMSAGPIEIDDDVTVTVPDGSVWTVV